MRKVKCGRKSIGHSVKGNIGWTNDEGGKVEWGRIETEKMRR